MELTTLDGEAIESISNSETDFIVKESFIDKKDPCFCESGKMIIECCIPEREFDEIVFKERMEKYHKYRR